MKNAKFLFVAVLLSISTILVPASAGALSDSAMVVLTADEAAPKQCTIKVKGTLNGDTFDISVTVEADNCAQAAADFLKQMAKK